MALSLAAKIGLGFVGASLFLRKGSTASASPAGVGTVANPAAASSSSTLAQLLANVLKGQQTAQQQQQKGGGGGGLGGGSALGGAAPKPSGGGAVGTNPWSQWIPDPGNVKEPTPLPWALPQLPAPTLPGSVPPAGQGSLEQMLADISGGNPILGSPDATQVNAADAANGIGISDPFGGLGGADPFAGAVAAPPPDLAGLPTDATSGDPFAGMSPSDFVDLSGLLSDPSISDPGQSWDPYGGGGGGGGYW